MDHPGDENSTPGSPKKPRQLPDDLPTSLDDRKTVKAFGDETEIYDAWQGQSQFLTNPIPAQNFNLDLSLGNNDFDDDETFQRIEDSDSRLVQMLANQARLNNDNSSVMDEDKILEDKKLSDTEKAEAMQAMLNLAASNGDAQKVKRIVEGDGRKFVDLNAPDSEGTPPLIYASCFGHEDVVAALINAGADINNQDRNQWSSLMWAMTNRHKDIAKMLLDSGANTDVKSSSGRTAFDFVAPNSEISEFLHEKGYNIGSVGVTDDFYSTGFSQDRFEEEMAENEMKRRMMMESAINLEVDLGNLGLDEQPESPGELEDTQDFVWDRCLNDQMFVFQENELGRILDITITNMTPQRSPSQKPVPANILFLSARYAHYHASAELLETLLVTAMDKINDVVEKHQWDMTILAFWISNATLLLHYLKKDSGLVGATTKFQLEMTDLINEIFILIIRDAERRMDKSLDGAMLDHETIPGFEDVTFQHEWKIFKTKTKVKPPEPLEKRFRPPSPKRRAQISPRNITSLLSSTLFVLDLYDVHSVITAQVLSQLMYWLGAELFNRIMSNRKYLARTKAMQIRMNVSALEDWARSNNRQAEHYENGSTTSSGETTVGATRQHLEPVVQLLQWLQCFSSFGEDTEAINGTLQQMPRLSLQQLIHAVKYYRPEVGEKGLPKTSVKYLSNLQKEAADRKAKHKKQASVASITNQMNSDSAPPTPQTAQKTQPGTPTPTTPVKQSEPMEEDDAPENLLFDPTVMLPFALPTSTDMLISYGAGFGGMNKERARKYIPTVPPEFLAKLDTSSKKNNGGVYAGTQWDSENTT